MQLPSNRKAKNQDYLAIVRKYCFLFLKSQYVKAPIRYLFQIDTTPSAPPSDYNPIPDVFIPTKYHDIILKDPIYVNNRYVVPGFHEKGKYIVRRPIYRTQFSDEYIPTHIVEKNSTAKN
uniref:Uncharacterized protein n=1 Tax=Rhizophagus irregularis (strain DAOM 181602 / DAOM 197198 / MUCL 43194) TaxID=747089 RepID=U9SR87_RHIID